MIEGRMKQRIDRWNGKRKKSLFGGKFPNVVFLVRDYSFNSPEAH